jgi:hypothetical protein
MWSLLFVFGLLFLCGLVRLGCCSLGALFACLLFACVCFAWDCFAWVCVRLCFVASVGSHLCWSAWVYFDYLRVPGLFRLNLFAWMLFACVCLFAWVCVQPVMFLVAWLLWPGCFAWICSPGFVRMVNVAWICSPGFVRLACFHLFR